MILSFNAAVELGRLIRFGTVGLAVTLVYAGATMLLIKSLQWSPLAASIFGQVIATGASYFGHSMFSFGVQTDHRTYLGRFLAILVLTFGLNVLVTWSLSDLMHFERWISVATLTVLIPAVNFVCNRYWVFLPGLK